MCQKAGLVSLGHVPLDGSKVKAYACKHKAVSHKRIHKSDKQLQAEMRALLCKTKLVNAQEARQFGCDNSGDELAEELKHRSRLEWIRKPKAKI